MMPLIRAVLLACLFLGAAAASASTDEVAACRRLASRRVSEARCSAAPFTEYDTLTKRAPHYSQIARLGCKTLGLPEYLCSAFSTEMKALSSSCRAMVPSLVTCPEQLSIPPLQRLRGGGAVELTGECMF